MPYIPTYQSQERAPRGPSSALAQPGMGTEKFRQFARLGEGVSGIGKVLSDMQAMDTRRSMMEANAKAVGAGKEFLDQEYLDHNIGDGAYTDETGQAVQRIPVAEMADRFVAKRNTERDRIIREHLSKVPSLVREQWKTGFDIQTENLSARVTNKQYEMLRDGEILAFHKERRASEDNLIGEVPVSTPEQLMAAYEVFEAETKSRAMESHQSPRTAVRVVEGARGNIGRAAETLIDQSIENGDIESAKRGYAILKEFDQIEPADYKQALKDLSGTIIVHQAQRAILSGKPGNIAQGVALLEDLETKELSADQLKAKNQLVRTGKREIQNGRHNVLAQIVLDMADHDADSVEDKAKLAERYKAQLDEYTEGMGEHMSLEAARQVRVIADRIDKWVNEDDEEVKTDVDAYAATYRAVRAIHATSSPIDVRRARELLNKNVAGKKLGRTDTKRLSTLLDTQVGDMVQDAIDAAIGEDAPIDLRLGLRKWAIDQKTSPKEAFIYSQEAKLVWRVATDEQKLAFVTIGPTRPEPDKTGIAQVTSEAEYDALPAGTTYLDPNGVKRRKR